MFQALWLGILLIIIGSLSSAFGLLLMKLSAETESHLPWHYKRKWAWGFVFLVVNATFIDLAAYPMTPLAVIAPFAGLTIIFGTLLTQSGWVCAKEHITVEQWVSIAIVVSSVVAITTSGPRGSDELSAANIRFHLFSLRFEIFSAISICGIVGALALWLSDGVAQRTTSAGWSVGALAFGSAASGALSQLSLKIVSTSISDGLNGEAGFFGLHSVLGILGLAVFAPLQLVMLNSTLVNSPVSFAVPLYETLLILLTVTAGGTFFNEFSELGIARVSIFAIGILISFVGLTSLARSTNSKAALVPEARKLISGDI